MVTYLRNDYVDNMSTYEYVIKVSYYSAVVFIYVALINVTAKFKIVYKRPKNMNIYVLYFFNIILFSYRNNYIAY